MLSDETHQFIRSHDSDFPPDLSTIKKVLFATNDQADIYNLEMLEAIPKRHKTYEAIDVGDVSLAAGGVQKVKYHLHVYIIYNRSTKNHFREIFERFFVQCVCR